MNPQQSDLIPLTEGVRSILGYVPDASVMHRWRRAGIRGADGRYYRLRTYKCGGRVMVRVQDLEGWMLAVAGCQEVPSS